MLYSTFPSLRISYLSPSILSHISPFPSSCPPISLTPLSYLLYSVCPSHSFFLNSCFSAFPPICSLYRFLSLLPYPFPMTLSASALCLLSLTLTLYLLLDPFCILCKSPFLSFHTSFSHLSLSVSFLFLYKNFVNLLCGFTGDDLAERGAQETSSVVVETVQKVSKSKQVGPVLPLFKSDASKVSSKGMGLKKAYLQKQNMFTVHAGDAGKLLSLYCVYHLPVL